MKRKKFSLSWGRSKQPRKQHKYRYNAPLHIKQKFLHAHLSPELRKKYSRRSIQLRKGDKIRVMRGEFSKREGRVERIKLKRESVFITGLEKIKKDGTKLLAPFHPSNLLVTELNLDDKERKQKLESKTEGDKIKEKDKLKENKARENRAEEDRTKETKRPEKEKKKENEEPAK